MKKSNDIGNTQWPGGIGGDQFERKIFKCGGFTAKWTSGFW